MSETLLDFGKMPVFIGCTAFDSPTSQDIYWDMKWGFKQDTTFGVINPPEPEKIYLEQHNELVGPTWNSHLLEFSKFVIENLEGNVLEIGGGNCYLPTKVFSQSGRNGNSTWDIIEPNPLVNVNEYGELINGWFPESLRRATRYETIVHSHVLEHVPSPLNFLRSCNESLVSEGKILFSIPNMKVMAENMDLNLLMFEHLTYLPENEVRNLLKASGFQNIKVKYFKNHSIFFSATKTSENWENVSFTSSIPRSEVVEICEKYDKTLGGNVEELNRLIKISKKPIWIFGAHVFTQYLIAKGLLIEKVSGILDNSIGKQGRRLYGTKLKVESPNFLQNSRVFVISPMGNYEPEILLQLQSILLPGSEVIGLRLGHKEIE